MKRHDRHPRKVIVGTSIFADLGYPTLAERLDETTKIIDEQNQTSRERYGRGPDIVVLTECALNHVPGKTPAEQAQPLDGEIVSTFAAKAREHQTNLCIPMQLAEGTVIRNASVLLNRQGEVAGVYSKLHPVNGYSNRGGAGDPCVLENGITPGERAEAIEMDFGKLGVQICYDMSYDDGWDDLRDQGAELVLWTTASPRMFAPAVRAARGGYWVASATSRCNAGILEPQTGHIHAEIEPPECSLVQEVDLSWLYLAWSPLLQNGAVFADAFGNDVGFHYLENEDCGLFWSNDPSRSIGDMAREIGFDPDYDRVEHCRQLREDILTS